jgi:membrane protease YdiL (CAAX protease family)
MDHLIEKKSILPETELRDHPVPDHILPGEPTPPVNRPKPVLRAATALVVLILFLAGQFLTAFAITVFKIVQYILAGGNIDDQAALTDLISNIMPYVALTSTLGGAAGLAVGALIVKKSLNDPTAYGAAWLKGSLKKSIVFLCLGAAVGLLYLLLPLFFFIPSEGTESGLFSQMALHPGLGRLVWVIIAILLAPLIEELLFRGIMLGGLSRSFGIFWGVVISNLLFIGAHTMEAIHYWPAFIGIGLLALTCTWQRLVQKAIGPAVFIHLGYNIVIVGATLLAVS